MKLLKPVLLFLLIYFQVIHVSFAQSIAISPLGELAADNQNKWIKDYFDTKLKDIEVIGLGEVSHGAHEPFAFKSEFIKYLIQEQNFRSIIFELDDPMLRELNSFLNDATPENKSVIEALMRKVSVGELFYVAEIRDLLSWIKSYNNTHQQDPVSFRGMDLAVDFFYFRDNYIDTAYYAGLKRNWEIKKIKSLGVKQQLEVLNKWFKIKEPELKQTLPTSSYHLMLLDLKNFNASVLNYENGGSGNANMFSQRDSIMAQNVNIVKSGKAIVWAHNAHLANSGFNMNKFRAKNLGNFLKEQYGSQYYIVLTDYSNKALVNGLPGNKLLLKSTKPDKRSAAAVLASQFKLTSGIITQQELKKHHLPLIFNNISQEGRSFILTEKENAFNDLVIFDTLSPSLPLH